MTIIENANLRLTLVVYADEEKDLVTLLRDVAKEIKRGSFANNVGSCLGSYEYNVVELSRATELRNEAVDAGQSCPSCGGTGIEPYQLDLQETCVVCKGTGHV